MERNEIASNLVVEYLKRFPSASKHAIARKLKKDNPLVFGSLETIRYMIRYYTGSVGNKHKGKTPENKVKFNTAFSYDNPFGLPDSDERKWEPYVMPTAANNILILSDVHMPYHNIKALTAAINYGKEQKVNAVILNGDVMDCYAISSFVKDPRARRFSEEIEMTRDFLKNIQKVLRAKLFFKLGNHEERWQRFLRVNAPAICDMDEFRLKVILNCEILGVELIEDKRIIKAGHLNIMHGHEFGKVSSAVNPARSYYLKTKQNVICGHLHQASEHTEPNLSGELATAFSTGCLCELHPEYAPINRWSHGFAHVHINKDGTFIVRNLRIINGKIV